MKLNRHAGIASIVAAVLLASVARAGGPEDGARRAFEEGFALEKKGDYARALAKFEESEQIKATLGNRYHKAYCLEMTGKLAAALGEYELLERAARESNKADLIEAARVRLEPLRARVPQVEIKLAMPAPAGVEASLDGAALDAARLDGTAFRVDPGEHELTARAPEREPFTRRFAAAEGSTTSIDLALAPLAAGPSAPTAATEPTAAADEGASRSRALPIATTAGAVALAGAGLAAFLVSAGEQEDLKAHCATVRASECDDSKGPTRTFDALALGSWIGAAGLAAVSVVLWTSSPSTTASAGARLTARPSSIALEGRF